MNEALVSVLIPCYNAEKYLQQSINSIINQTYKNLEIIVIDDCSTDNSLVVLKQIAATDSRIRVIENEQNLRLIKTLNKGISLCNGDYIARMDADDISMPMRIEKEVDFLEKNKDHDIVSTLFYAFHSEKPSKKTLHKNPLKYEEMQAYMLFKSGICHPASMIRKRVFTELNLKFEAEYLHVEDYALWSKAIYLTKIANIGEGLLLYRVHPTQVSTQNFHLQTENKKKVYKIHCQHLGLPTSDEFIDIYASVAECVPKDYTEEYLHKCEQFILSLYLLNQKKLFCDDQYLHKLLSLHWLRLCANSCLGLKAIRIVKSSKVYQKVNYSFSDIAILYFKCIFKIEYKKSAIYKIIFK